MAERRSKFEKQFRNVWSTGPTGVSMVQVSVDNSASADDLVARMFKDTLVADVEQFKTGVTRSFVKNSKEEFFSDQQRIVGITSDDRVAELIELVAANNATSHNYPSFDFVVTPLATGSKDYIEWVQLQTQKKDPSTAFFNQGPEAAMKSLDNKIPDMAPVPNVQVV